VGRIVDTEAAVLREAAHRAMAGERLATVARDLRSRGIPSPTGRLRTDATLGRLLRNPRMVGDRAYKGQVVARDCWPAILDRDTFSRLQLTLNHPARQGAPPRHHKRLATGFAQCGLCGQSASTTTRSGVRYYSCPTQPTGCGRIHVRADRLESWLLDRLLDQLRLEPPPTAQDADPGDIAKAMAELCRDYYVERIVPRAEFLSARSLLVRRADEVSRRSGRRPEAARVLAAANPRKQLGALDVGKLRDLLADRLDRLVVNPMIKPQRGVFDARRLRCEWRKPT
jgi:site-specific DNA recombinase